MADNPLPILPFRGMEPEPEPPWAVALAKAETLEEVKAALDWRDALTAAAFAHAFQTGNPAALIEWFEDGADGQIDWCSSGDFDACVEVASAYLDDPEGFCNVRHQSVCGGPPGSEGGTRIIGDIALRGTPWEFYSEDQPRDEGGKFGESDGGISHDEPAGVAAAELHNAEASLVDLVHERGGFTVQPLTGEIPTSGYIVALDGTSAFVKEDEFYGEGGIDAIDAYLRDHAEDFDKGDTYMGLWDDTANGEVVIDVVVNVASEQAALAMGTDQDQQSIYDVTGRTEIATGGTGKRGP